MSEKKYDELQKMYDNPRIGALVQEICEYYASHEITDESEASDDLQPHEIVEAAYILLALQSREQILDEFSIVQKKYPELYKYSKDFHNTLLINMDYRALEKSCALRLADYAVDTTGDEVLSHIETFTRSSESLSDALDKFYGWLKSRSR